MKLDDFKEPLQKQQRQLDDRVDHVIKAVRSRMSWFDRVIWFRDLRESVVAMLLFAWFSYDLFRHPEWVAKLGLIVGMFVCVSIVVTLNWTRLIGRVARPGQAIDDYCNAELARVDRQIWLLRNINRWYTGPLFVAGIITLCGLMEPPKVLVFSLTFLLPIGWFVYWVNQRAVRLDLMPLREELAGVMEVTAENTVVEDDDRFPSKHPSELSRGSVVVAIVGMFALILTGAYIFERLNHDSGAPKISPFTEVRFDGNQVWVTFDENNYRWLEIDGIQVDDILSTAKWRFGFLWQKRVAEDLVEVLWRMDHRPGDTVSLRLFDADTNKEVTIDDAPMNADNRFAVRWNRDHAEQEAMEALLDGEPADEDLPIDAELRARLVGRYQLNPDFIFDVRDRDGRLMVGITNQQTQEVFPDSASRWSYRSVDATLEFKLGRTGPARRLILHQNAIRQSAHRISP